MYCKLLIYKRIYQIGGGNSTIFDKKENVICGYANNINLAKKMRTLHADVPTSLMWMAVLQTKNEGVKVLCAAGTIEQLGQHALALGGDKAIVLSGEQHNVRNFEA